MCATDCVECVPQTTVVSHLLFVCLFVLFRFITAGVDPSAFIFLVLFLAFGNSQECSDCYTCCIDNGNSPAWCDWTCQDNKLNLTEPQVFTKTINGTMEVNPPKSIWDDCNCYSNPLCGCPSGFYCCEKDHHRCCTPSYCANPGC